MQAHSNVQEARRADTQDLLRHSWSFPRVMCQPSGLDDSKRGDCPRVLLECFHSGAFFASLHLCVFAFKQPCPVPVADALMAVNCHPPGEIETAGSFAKSTTERDLCARSITCSRPPQPPRPLLPRPKPRWRRGAKRLNGADVKREDSSRISTRKRALR